MNLRGPASGDCLMLGMAARLGVDVDALIAAGRISASDLAGMKAGCRGCVRRDDCILWLVENGSADAAPGYCLNGERLAALRG